MKVYNFPQYSTEWWDVRCGIPTASNADCIVTPGKWEMSSQARGYACELIGQHYDYNYGMNEEYVTAAMRNGSIMEPEARRFYEFETGTTVDQVGFCLSDCGRFGCSPDGLVGDDGGLELKHPTAKTQVEWLYTGLVPAKYLPQIHWSMIVTGRKWWDFMAYYPGLPPLLRRVEPNEQTEKLRTAMDCFHALLTEIRQQVEQQEPMRPQVTPQESYF